MSVDNYVCTLDTASIKKAKDELNEVPEDRLAAVQAFREWIVAQPHIRCPNTDTIFLLRFLRWSKFSQIRARGKLEDYLNLGKTLPKVFSNLDPIDADVTEMIKMGYIFPLPKPDKDGRAILFCKMENCSKLFAKYGVSGMYKTSSVMTEYVNREESAQVNGIVFVLDFHGITAGIMAKFLTPETGRIEKEWIKAMPGRYKAFHYYRAGVLIDAMVAFFRPFVPKKFMDRIYTHDTMETIYEHVPKELLPSEYLPDDYSGPSAGTVKECIDTFLNRATDKEFRDDLLYRTSSAFGIDESKRPAEVVTQHFRKLNVD